MKFSNNLNHGAGGCLLGVCCTCGYVRSTWCFDISDTGRRLEFGAYVGAGIDPLGLVRMCIFPCIEFRRLLVCVRCVLFIFGCVVLRYQFQNGELGN